jgi:hypothetical protein
MKLGEALLDWRQVDPTVILLTGPFTYPQNTSDQCAVKQVKTMRRER